MSNMYIVRIVKKTILLSFLMPFLFSCGGNDDVDLDAENNSLKEEVAALTESNLEYEKGVDLFANDIETYRNALAEIEKNIAAVDTKHDLVVNLKGDIETDKKVEDDILNHISHIHATMLNSKHKVAHLHNSLNKAAKDGTIHKDSVQVLDQTFYDLATAVYVQDKVIKGMHTMIVDDAKLIKELDDKYESQKMESDVLHLIINTKFYVIGTKEELLEKGVITDENDLSGLGRVEKLSATTNAGVFTSINAAEEYLISFEAKAARLITIHPKDHYLFLGEENNAITGIEINDYKSFWDKSDFLIIEIEK